MARTKKMAFGGLSNQEARQNVRQDKRDLRAAGGPGDTAAQQAMQAAIVQGRGSQSQGRGVQQQARQNMAPGTGGRGTQQEYAARMQQGMIPPGGSLPPMGPPGSIQTGPRSNTGAQIPQYGRQQVAAGQSGSMLGALPPAGQNSQTSVPAGLSQYAAQMQQKAAPTTSAPPVPGRTFGDQMAARLAAQNSSVPQYGQGPGQGFGQPPNAAKVGMFKKGGSVKTTRFAEGGGVKEKQEPPISKATQESMKRQAAQEKADRKQAEEQKAGEKEVKDNMGRLGFKKGGSIKASKMGVVKVAKPTMRSASSRADGIAIRGKTRA